MSASTMADSRQLEPLRSGSLAEIAKEFLRLGFVAFGGPAAHVAMMEERFVRRLSWLSRERFLDMLGAVNLLPGPSSTELAIYLGETRGGLPGLMVAGACFILPAAILVVALAWAYQAYGSVPQVAGLLVGIKPVVVALIVQAVWNLARTALKNVPLAILAVAVVALAAFGVPVLALLIGAGILWIVVREGQRLATSQQRPALALGMLAPLAANSIGLIPLFLYFLKIGAILFGSGYVLLAVLRADLVLRLHWLTDAQLLDAIAVSQATPGPFFTVSTFIGYLLNGWKGAALATVGMFLPAFLYVAVTAQFLPGLRKSPIAGAFLDGVNASAVALMSFVGYQFARAALVNVSAIVVALVTLFLIFRYKINSSWLVLGGAILGILLHGIGRM
ncbi:MAG TPA: chromate efflux transporter [Methylomirabilota bacterium]|nr:chromate efflux transporter [Methylomirabilota bacterium]